MARPNASMTARERARAELTREIKEEAKRQLAVAGADGLSLRAVARSLGLASSALYRYFPSRDDLLTALIIDAYNSLGETTEKAIGSAREAGDSARGQWVAACCAVRAWAKANPHEYALIYGSPVPGYRAPEATIGPASRVPLAFTGILRDASAPPADAGAGAGLGVPVEGILAEQCAALTAALAREGHRGPALPPGVLVRGVMAWTQLFGMVSFELFGQFVGSFDPPDAFFEHAVAEMAALAGL
jgi:AcrR family transcriptional regulator